MSFWRTGLLALVLLFMAANLDASAQPVPVMGYVAAKNANHNQGYLKFTAGWLPDVGHQSSR